MPFSIEARLIMATLALYGVAWVITKGDGLFGSIAQFRVWFANLDPIDEETGEGKIGFAKLITCPYCTGFWAAPFVFGLAFIQTLPTDIILGVLAIVGAHYVLIGVTNG